MKITGNNIPEQGRYIEKGQSIAVKIFLQNQVYVFRLQKPIEKLQSDWLLTLEIHQLDSTQLEIQQLAFPIWVFWYRPSDETSTQINTYLHNLINYKNTKLGLVFYLQNSPNQSSATSNIESSFESKLFVVQLPDPTQGFSHTVAFMTHLIKKAVEFPV